MADLEEQLAGIAALAEPVRLRLYRFVSDQARPVTREQAAAGLGIPVHQAKFHLDRLVADRLLTAEFAHVGPRRGPGSGRTSKLYRRAADEFSVTLPERRYTLAGKVLATAVDRSRRDGVPVQTALDQAARAHGAGLAVAREEPATADERFAAVLEVLAEEGYEPAQEAGRSVLRNCPFHALAEDHTDLVCGMNLCLIEGLADALGGGVTARLEPSPGRCCVVLTAPGALRGPRI